MNKGINKLRFFLAILSWSLGSISFAQIYSGDPMNGMGAMGNPMYTGEQNGNMINGAACPPSVMPMQGVLGQPQMQQQQQLFQQPGNHLYPQQQQMMQQQQMRPMGM